MTGILSLLQSWVAGAEHLVARVPGLAVKLEPGSWPLAVVVGLCGALLLVFGLHLARLVAACGGAFVGWAGGSLLAVVLHPLLPAVLPPWLLPALVAALVALAGFIEPAAYAAALGVLPGALLGAQVPLGGRALFGAIAGALALGLLGLLLRRVLLAASASVGGAVLLCAALLALAPHVAILGVLRGRPTLLAALGAVLAIAGTAYQAGRRPSGGRGGGMGGGPSGHRSAPAREPRTVAPPAAAAQPGAQKG